MSWRSVDEWLESLEDDDPPPVYERFLSEPVEDLPYECTVPDCGMRFPTKQGRTMHVKRYEHDPEKRRAQERKNAAHRRQSEDRRCWVRPCRGRRYADLDHHRMWQHGLRPGERAFRGIHNPHGGRRKVAV